MNSSFNTGIMLSLQEKTLIIKHFYKKDEWVTIAALKFRTTKVLRKEELLILLSGILKVVHFFNETRWVGDRLQTVWPTLRVEYVAAVLRVM